jgi:hypothetical protein
MNEYNDEHDDCKGQMCHVPVLEEPLHLRQIFDAILQGKLGFVQGDNF